MDTSYLTHTERVRALLTQLENDRDHMLQLGMRVMGGAGADMYTLDFSALGSVKRYLSTTTAFRLMIETWNMVRAPVLLRTHIDTALRFSGGMLRERSQCLCFKSSGW